MRQTNLYIFVYQIQYNMNKSKNQTILKNPTIVDEMNKNISKNSIDPTKLNIPELICNSQYYQHISLIKNYEDTLTKLFAGSKNTNLTQQPDIFLWKIYPNENNILTDIQTPNFSDFLTEDLLKGEQKLENIIIMGPYVRSCMSDNKSAENKISSVRNEIYMYGYSDTEWENIFNLDKFTEKKNEYIVSHNNKKICLIKKKYKSPSQIILQHGYLKRIGYTDNHFLVSSMFLIEFQKHNNLIKSNFNDPILGFPYDPLEIYQSPQKDTSDTKNLIRMVDDEKLLKIPKKVFTILFDNKTILEMLIERMISEEHPVVSNNLEKLILYFADAEYQRPPALYAKNIGFEQYYPHIYQRLVDIKNLYEIDSNDFEEMVEQQEDGCSNPIEVTNNQIIRYLVQKDNYDELTDYLKYINYQINQHILDLVIRYNSANIQLNLLKGNAINQPNAYYLILQTQNIQLIKYLKLSFDINIGLNYLKDIIENNLIRSFYYLYENEQTICDTVFDEGMNILHLIKDGEKVEDMIKLIMKLNPKLINQPDNNKQTPIIYHSKHNPRLIGIFLAYDFDGSICDLDGNIFLHYLCQHNHIQIIRNCLKKYHEFIDMPNKKYQTPVIISCKSKQEDVFYMLKSMGADLTSKDYYGNTVYHYITVNSMCLGMSISDTPNYFGFTPSDYSKLAASYYNFTDILI